LKWKNLLISKLEARVVTTEANVRDQANKGLEEARAVDQREIEQLRAELEKMHQSAQINQAQVSQQEELIQ
jgi:hypothetical protein